MNTHDDGENLTLQPNEKKETFMFTTQTTANEKLLTPNPPKKRSHNHIYTQEPV